MKPFTKKKSQEVQPVCVYLCVYIRYYDFIVHFVSDWYLIINAQYSLLNSSSCRVIYNHPLSCYVENVTVLLRMHTIKGIRVLHENFVGPS